MRSIDDIITHPIPPSTDGVFNFLPESLNKIKQIEVATYSHRAGAFDEAKVLGGGFEEMALFEPVLEKAAPDALFLELAGGDGRFALQLMKRGYQVVETDIALGSVQRTRGFAEKMGVADKNFFMVVDAEHMPFRDNVFDGVFMVAALHHVPDAAKALAEMCRVLKPGGSLLILREPASWAYYILWPIKAILRPIIRWRNPHEPKSLADDVTMGFSRRKLRRLFTQVGFHDVQIKPVDYLKKVYTNYCFIKARLLRREYKVSSRIAATLHRWDQGIAKVPLVRALSWDWDCWMKK